MFCVSRKSNSLFVRLCRRGKGALDASMGAEFRGCDECAKLELVKSGSIDEAVDPQVARGRSAPPRSRSIWPITSMATAKSPK